MNRTVDEKILGHLIEWSEHCDSPFNIEDLTNRIITTIISIVEKATREKDLAVIENKFKDLPQFMARRPISAMIDPPENYSRWVHDVNKVNTLLNDIRKYYKEAK